MSIVKALNNHKRQQAPNIDPDIAEISAIVISGAHGAKSLNGERGVLIASTSVLILNQTHNIISITKPKMAECPRLIVQSGNKADRIDQDITRPASPKQATDVVGRGRRNIVVNCLGQHNYTTLIAHCLRVGPAADSAANLSVDSAAPADTVNMSALHLREGLITDTVINPSADTASSAERDIAFSFNHSTDTSNSGNKAVAVLECAMVSAPAHGQALASSREHELVNGHACTTPASPPPSYSVVPHLSSTHLSSTHINAIIKDDSTVEDDDTLVEVLPTYKRWEDIPPIYKTLRVPPKFAMASHAASCSPPPSPTPRDFNNCRPSTPPSPTPSRISKRMPFCECYLLDPQVMEAVARAAALKQVQEEMERRGMGWAGPLAQRVIPSTA
ncbi:hypothetical protein CALVIDRAFT_568345 [Calocera viscosa TUFC12733]|uniref:Uncharacterized protein n=1 Tax=Calocera viscosa (strain TUFC12733) TaxID=1330018 RepID=A0A167H726_CALVF|nr:hypothetical protein CALVIDRAFT_568345 [Calocera viscosa TUFC12733]